MVSKAVLIRSGLVSLTTAKPVNTAQPRTTVNSARPMKNVFNKAHSTIRRPINKNTTLKNSNFNQMVNTVKDKNVNAARPKAVLNAVKGNQINVVKASTFWITSESLMVMLMKILCWVLWGIQLKSNSIVKAFKSILSRTSIVKENMHVQFSENTPYIAGSGPNWFFDIDALTKKKLDRDSYLEMIKEEFTEEPGKRRPDIKVCKCVPVHDTKSTPRFHSSLICCKRLFSGAVVCGIALIGSLQQEVVIFLFSCRIFIFMVVARNETMVANSIIEAENVVCMKMFVDKCFDSESNYFDYGYSEELNNAGKILDESKGREKVFRKEQTFVSNNSGAKFKQNKKQRSRRPKRKDTEVPQPSGPTTNVTNKAVYEERDDSLERDTTTATGLHIEQDMCNINKTQSKATPNEPSSPHGTNQGRSFRRQGKPWGIQLLHTRVIDLEKIKTAQAQEITSLKLRVKKLEKKGGSRTHKLKRLYQGRKIDDIEDKDAEITYG
ncbi:hypothetical protein Tco_0432052 [Tanacetum coccineum]